MYTVKISFVLNLMKSLYDQSVSCVRANGLQREWFEITSGVVSARVASLHRTRLLQAWTGSWIGRRAWE